MGKMEENEEKEDESVEELRAFGATSFEEERRLVLARASSLANVDWDKAQSAETSRLAKELGAEFKRASPQMKGDREAVLGVVSMGGSLLGQCSEALRDDFEVVAAAVSSVPLSIRHASERLRSDKNLMLQAVRKLGITLEYAGEEVKEDRDIVFEAVKSWASALQYAGEGPRGDREVVLASVESEPETLEYASDLLRVDREVVLKALQQRASKKVVWMFVGPELKQDKEIVLQAVRWASDEDDGYHCYDQAGDLVKRSTTWQQMWGSACSRLACTGDESPILTIRVPELPNSTSCEINLISGLSFTCELPDRPGHDYDGSERPVIILEDLARKVLDALPIHTQIQDAKSLFLVFTNESGDSWASSPWDWDQPLAAFLRWP